MSKAEELKALADNVSSTAFRHGFEYSESNCDQSQVKKQRDDARKAREALRAAIDAQQSIIDEQRADIERMRSAYYRACKLVADMHAAAMGTNVGPVLGVIEDVAALRLEVERLRAQDAEQEPVAWAIGYGGKPLYLWNDGDGAQLDLEVKRQGGDCQKMALYLAPQPREPIQSSIAATPEDMKVYEAIAQGYWNSVQQPAPVDVPLPEPVWPKGFFGSLPRGAYSEDQMLAHRKAHAKAVLAAERERCAKLLDVTRADVSLAAGELSAQEWRTCEAVLRWMQARIRAKKGTT
jgi:hypothetical protein